MVVGFDELTVDFHPLMRHLEPTGSAGFLKVGHGLPKFTHRCVEVEIVEKELYYNCLKSTTFLTFHTENLLAIQFVE